MKRFQIIVALFALCALGAITTSVATAEQGFLPRKTNDVTLASTGAVTFETASKTQIKCAKLDESPGTLSSDKHWTVTLHVLGCKALGFAMNSLGDKSEELLAETLVLFCGFLLSFPFVHLAFELDKGSHLEIPAVGVLLELAGQVLGDILTTGPAKEYLVDFSGKEGKQNTTECKDGKETKKNTLTTETNHSGTKEATSLGLAGGSAKLLEEMELMES
jgi:hypothetical protein